MITYDYIQDLSLEQVNDLAETGWEVSDISILETASGSTFDVFVKKGFQDKVLVEGGSGERFFFDESISYGEGMILTFVTISFFVMVGILIFKFIFRK